ncbi:MAG: glycosyltransferase family 4 protein [Armatimonadetes bacterium]|nr:glycosyltransferase family 4 protein [Armatimonadota bacterium]
MSRKKVIAMVAYTFLPSDARINRHVKALLEAGYEVDLYVLNDPKMCNFPPDERVKIHLLQNREYNNHNKCNVIRSYLSFWMSCSCAMLKNHLAGRKYSLVHINNMPNFLVFSAWHLKLLGVPVLLDIHDTMPEIYQERFSVPKSHKMIKLLFIEERMSMKFAKFVLTTEHTKWNRLMQNNLREDKSEVVLNLPDYSIFPNDESSETKNTDTFRLVYHGTLTRRLGMDVAVRAMAKLVDRIPSFRFDIIGDGEQRAELVELTKELNLENWVHFSDGFVPTTDLPKLLAGSQLAIIPSRNSVGTELMLPTKMLEYVRMGIPCITVATPTIAYYFNEKQVHFVESENVDELADAIYELYSNTEERLSLAREAERFWDQYSYYTEKDKYLNIVQNLVAGKRGKPR